jgi:hypothetical protein
VTWIVAAELDPVTFGRLDALRAEHFPPERNHLRAHLTLFHHLEEDDRTREALRAAAATAGGPVPLRVARVVPLGRGVAYAVECPGLAGVRAHVAAALEDVLTPQDRQGWRPHVTVQNKVDPAAARALRERLEATFEPWEGEATALLVHRYAGGPWDPPERLPLG